MSDPAVPPAAAPFDARLAGKALGERLAGVEAAMERLGSFVFSEGQDTKPGSGDQTLVPAQRMETARELVLRALAAVGDTLNFRILRRLAAADAPLAELAALVGVTRVAAWERVGDLVQVGLVARAVDEERVGLTPAGEGLVRLVEELAVAAEGRP